VHGFVIFLEVFTAYSFKIWGIRVAWAGHYDDVPWAAPPRDFCSAALGHHMGRIGANHGFSSLWPRLKADTESRLAGGE
jgi:hypothetical protein